MTSLTFILAEVDKVRDESLRECDSAFAEATEWLEATVAANLKRITDRRVEMGLAKPQPTRRGRQARRHALQTVEEADDAGKENVEEQRRSAADVGVLATGLAAADPVPINKRKSSGDGDAAAEHERESGRQTRRTRYDGPESAAPAAPEAPARAAAALVDAGDGAGAGGNSRGPEVGPDPLQLNVKQLKVELRTRGLPIKGLKADLVKRLQDVLAEEAGRELPHGACDAVKATSVAAAAVDGGAADTVDESSVAVEPRADVGSGVDGAGTAQGADAEIDAVDIDWAKIAKDGIDAAKPPASQVEAAPQGAVGLAAGADMAPPPLPDAAARQARRRGSDLAGVSVLAAAPAARASGGKAAVAMEAEMRDGRESGPDHVADAATNHDGHPPTMPPMPSMPPPPPPPASITALPHHESSATRSVAGAAAASGRTGLPLPPASVAHAAPPASASALALRLQALQDAREQDPSPPGLDALRNRVDNFKASRTPAVAPPRGSSGAGVPAASTGLAPGIPGPGAGRDLAGGRQHTELAAQLARVPRAAPALLAGPPARASSLSTAQPSPAHRGQMAAATVAATAGHASPVATDSAAATPATGGAEAAAVEPRAVEAEAEGKEREAAHMHAVVVLPDADVQGPREAAAIAEPGVGTHRAASDDVPVIAEVDAPDSKSGHLHASISASLREGAGAAGSDRRLQPNAAPSQAVARVADGMQPSVADARPPALADDPEGAAPETLHSAPGAMPLPAARPPDTAGATAPPPHAQPSAQPPDTDTDTATACDTRSPERPRRRDEAASHAAPQERRGPISAVARAVTGALLSGMSGGPSASGTSSLLPRVHTGASAAAAPAQAKARDEKRRRHEEVAARKQQEEEARRRAMAERERDREAAEARRKAEEEKQRRRKHELAEERARRVREEAERRERQRLDQEAELRDREEQQRRRRDKEAEEAADRKRRHGAPAAPPADKPKAAAPPSAPAPQEVARRVDGLDTANAPSRTAVGTGPYSAAQAQPMIPAAAKGASPPDPPKGSRKASGDRHSDADGDAEGYAISDHKSTDEEDSSDDEDDGEEYVNPAKKIPAWAAPENLKAALEKQVTADPDDIFANVETCDLMEIFAPDGKSAKERYSRRGSSGNWKADQLTWREVHEYNQAMGYYKGQHSQ